MKPTNFLIELKRRNVYRAAVAYGVVAWFLTQLTTQVFPFFEIPNWAIRLVIMLIVIGFPIASFRFDPVYVSPKGGLGIIPSLRRNISLPLLTLTD